ncbi:protein of unknown function DUF323 [alpha proteobacterium U9-1i]|nr:protein of unknown function DUF323 [alpha proteobacterium U9-1i]
MNGRADLSEIFLSYAREDRDRVAPIVEALKAEGLPVYWDRQLEYGGNWLQEINAHLDAAPAIVVIWSQYSIASPFVQAEAMKGFDRQVLVPISIEANLRPPAPFGMVQGADFAAGVDRNDGEWRILVDRLKSLVRKAAADGVSASPHALSDTVRAARTAHQEKIAGIAGPLRGIAAGSDVAQPEIARSIDAVLERLSRDDLFTIAVVGRMKVGKSTLLNALLGPTERVSEAPLPVEDLPCTATLIKLRYADEPYCRPFIWDQSRNSIGAAMTDWSFQDFHERARIYLHGGETNIFDTIAEFEVGWPSKLLRAGVTLMDSPGISENPRRTELTRQALAEVDAAVIVYRSEPLAGTDEIEFAEEVTERAGKTFTLVNMRGDHTMPPSPNLEKVVRARLSLDPHKTLAEQEVFFAHFRDGLKASYKRDGQLSEQSGLGPIQRRLAAFLISERYLAHVLKALRELAPLAQNLERSTEALIAGATADVGALRDTIKACGDDLARIERKQASIESLLSSSKEAIEAAAQRSFEAKVGQIAFSLPDRLDGVSLGVDGFLDKLGAGTIQNSKWVSRTADKINALVRSDLETWASAPTEKTGLAQDLKPTMDQMLSALRAQAQEIAEILQNMQARITALKPSLGGEGKIVGEMEMAASVVSGALLFGPLGIVGLGGWRGVAGAIGGTLAAGFGVALVTTLLHIAFPPTLIVTLIGAGGALAGAVFGSTADIEKRLKKKAWAAVEPKLRELAQNTDAKAQLRASIGQWFDEIRARMAGGLAEIINIQRANLTRLEQLTRDSQDKAQLIERLGAQRSETLSALSVIATMDEEVSAAMKKAG